MATFTVDPATLEHLAATLSSIRSEMESMRGVAVGYQGHLGGDWLDAEVERFCSHWGYGLGQLTEHMTKVVARLQAAAAAYERSEDEIETAAQARCA